MHTYLLIKRWTPVNYPTALEPVLIIRLIIIGCKYNGTVKSQLGYIQGVKKDSKTVSMDMDEQYRKKLNLDEIYK